MTSDRRGTTDRQVRAASTFVELVGTLADDFDVVEMLTVLSTRSIELVDAAAAGVLLRDHTGNLRVVAASTEQITLLELFQVQAEQGPCIDCVRTGAIVAATDLRTTRTWPKFAAQSVAAGYVAVCAIPLRVRRTTLGCLNLFLTDPASLSEDDVHLARALADVASIAILQDEAARDAAVRETGLQHAMDSRMSIEQAKGMLAAHGDIGITDAFGRLRSFARNSNRKLTEVADSMLAGQLSLNEVLYPPQGSGRRQPG